MAGAAAGGQEEMLQVADYLIARERDANRLAANPAPAAAAE